MDFRIMPLQYAFVLLLSMLPLVTAHMVMSVPIPMNSKDDDRNTNPDYNLMAPLSPDGSQFPCKLYHEQKWAPNEPALRPDTDYNVTLVGDAIHNGGSCQLSLSYDSGATFHVIKSFIGGCPSTHGKAHLGYTIPDIAPSGEAIFAWTWLNHNGNREFYMNCAVVKIDNEKGDARAFSKLPGIWVANQKKVNSCTTKETEDPVFPNPGPDVEYGGGLSTSSTKSPADCEVPKGNDKSNYKPTSGQRQKMPLAMAEMSSGAVAGSTLAASLDMSQLEVILATVMGAPEPSNSMIQDPMASDTSCAATMIFTVTSTSTSTVCPSCTTFATVTTTCDMQSMGCSSPLHPPSPTQSTRPLPPSGDLPYVSPQDLARYLPCDPGSFLCGDKFTFYTCDQTGHGWAWQYPRSVAAGMMCLPDIEPNTPGMEQQPGAPAGYFRSDLYARDRPHGSCSPDGSIGCLSGGTTWMMCTHGGWIEMGSVADGTMCVNGNIVRA